MITTYTPREAYQAMCLFDHLFGAGLVNGRDPAAVAAAVERRKKKKGSRKPNAPEILALEQQFATEVYDAWTATGMDAAREVAKMITAGAGGLTAAEIGAMLALVAEKMGSPFASLVGSAVETLTKGAYEFGRVTFVQSPAWNLVDEQARAWLTQNQTFWIGERYGEAVGPRIAETAKSVIIEQGLGRKEAAKALMEAFGDEFGQKSQAYWQTTAASGATRARNFGAVESMVEGGFTKMRAVAVMDARTSDICRYLNNKVWLVAWAADQRDAMMKAKTPALVKKASKWLSFKQIDGKSTKQLTAMGVVLAPYHGNCRTVNVVV